MSETNVNSKTILESQKLKLDDELLKSLSDISVDELAKQTESKVSKFWNINALSKEFPKNKDNSTTLRNNGKVKFSNLCKNVVLYHKSKNINELESSLQILDKEQRKFFLSLDATCTYNSDTDKKKISKSKILKAGFSILAIYRKSLAK